jgi:hypothetical protein
MPTKISLALGNPRNLSRQTAWGCFTSNLSVPGLGSLVAGRRVGYIQLTFALVGMAFTAFFGVQFIYWYLSHSKGIEGQDDPIATLQMLWQHVRFALFGIAVFLMGWLWALFTSIGILSQAKANEKRNVPPKFG